jgi:hypothetical protein
MDVMDRNGRKLLHRKLKVSRASGHAAESSSNNKKFPGHESTVDDVICTAIRNKIGAVIKISTHQCLMGSDDMQFRF